MQTDNKRLGNNEDENYKDNASIDLKVNFKTFYHDMDSPEPIVVSKIIFHLYLMILLPNRNAIPWALACQMKICLKYHSCFSQ